MPDPTRPPARLAATVPGAGRRGPRPAARRRARRLRRGRLAARRPPRPRARGLGPRHRRLRSGSSRCFRGAVYENRFGTVAVRRGDDVYEITTFRTEHEYADFRRPHRVEFGDRRDRRPRPARLHRERDRLGPGGRGRRADGLRGPVRRARGPGSARSCAPWATRRPGSARTRCACSAPCAWRRPWGSRSNPRRSPRSRANAALVGPPLGRADRRRAGEAARGAARRRSGCALAAGDGPARR